MTRLDGFILLENMLIGDRFHWEKIIKAKLPGEVEIFSLPSKRDITGEITGNISLINKVPIETYLECVVGSEMNPLAPMEFLKAHAVISRSWILGKVKGIHNSGKEGFIDSPDKLVGWYDTSAHQGFDVCSDDHCQRYQGIQDIPENNRRAIQETAGEVLFQSDGKILDTRFSKCCGGITEKFSTCWQPVDMEALQSFKDPWCSLSDLTYDKRKYLLSTVLKDYDLSTDNYGYEWEHKISKKEIEENLKKYFDRNIGKVKRIEVVDRGPSGRIDLMRIAGEKGSLELGKELWIRRLLSTTHLYSSAFRIKDKGDMIVLKGKGWGHGVGLCQIGAANMAFHGHNYREILTFYYPGSRLSKLS